MKMTAIDRSLILITALLASYQIVVGIDGLGTVPITAYTIAFGALLVAMLLLIILGFGILDSPVVVIVSSVIPLSLSLGLVWEHLASYRTLYLLFTIVGFAAVIFTRSISIPGKLQTFVLAVVHGIAGMAIFLLPSILAADGTKSPAFALVGLGGTVHAHDRLFCVRLQIWVVGCHAKSVTYFHKGENDVKKHLVGKNFTFHRHSADGHHCIVYHRWRTWDNLRGTQPDRFRREHGPVGTLPVVVHYFCDRDHCYRDHGGACGLPAYQKQT